MILKVPLAPHRGGCDVRCVDSGHRCTYCNLFAAVVALWPPGALTALLVVALTVVVGSFDGDILQPLIMGFAVNLHPLAIVSMICVSGQPGGIIGALLAVPIGGTVCAVARLPHRTVHSAATSSRRSQTQNRPAKLLRK